jgi:hypothetical protein
LHLWSLCVFFCFSVVVVEGASVRGCRGLGLCTVGTVVSIGGECISGRVNLVRVCWYTGGGSGNRRESG